ncbi:MAG: DUF192 domain-containing protein, partial [Eudoraea sp.]|nr:DUF192 domain-containing protein [Eudoraea sp.]
MKCKMPKSWYYLLVLLLSLSLGCKQEKKNVKTEVISFTKEGELSIYKGETDSLIA